MTNYAAILEGPVLGVIGASSLLVAAIKTYY